MRQLERHVADGAIHCSASHTDDVPLAKLAQEAIRPDDGAGSERECPSEPLNSGRRFRKSSVSTGFVSSSASDSRRSTCSAGRLQARPHARGREVERCVEQRAKSLPVGGGDGHVDSKDAVARPIRHQRTGRQRPAAPSPSRAARSVGNAQHGGDFLLGHAREIAHLHHLHKPRVFALQRLMASLIWRTSSSPARRSSANWASSGTCSITATALAWRCREIDDDRTHDARRVGEEVAALRARKFAGALEAQEALVQQYRGVQQRVAAAATQLRARLTAQVFICDGEQALARGFVAGVRALNQ
jgi:hypothetical protein